MAVSQVRNVMMGSKLPMSMLGKIWDLADQDKDGSLDRFEYLLFPFFLILRSFVLGMSSQLQCTLCTGRSRVT